MWLRGISNVNVGHFYPQGKPRSKGYKGAVTSEQTRTRSVKVKMVALTYITLKGQWNASVNYISRFCVTA